MATNLFNPVMGPEKVVLATDPSSGSVYFTTDTRKIYLDVDNNRVKLPMGGNIGLFYGNMKLSSPPVDGQTEFQFKISEIVGNESGEKLLIPNINDLILNQDGCFYKVKSLYGIQEDTILETVKLTIAGTGGGSGGGSSTPGSLAGAKFSRLKFASGTSILYGEDCWVEFATYVTNDLGDPVVGNVGSFQLYIDGAPIDLKGNNKVISTSIPTVDTGIENVPLEQLNRINVGPYLPLKDTSIEVKISATCNGITFTRAGNIYVTDLTLTWDYDETTVNFYDTDDAGVLLKWKVTGRDIEKITYITINDKIQLDPIHSAEIDQEYKLSFKELNLWHGAHKIEMYTTAIIGGIETPKKNVIRKNMIVAKSNDASAIISCGLFEDTLTQYGTVSIPIMIYQHSNTGATAIIQLKEQGEDIDTWENVPNCNADRDDAIRYWIYTPTQAGDIQLKILCNGATYTKNISVEPLELDVEEVSGYSFRIKANEISSNDALQKWEWNNAKLNFSSNFDWNNGGLKNEKDKSGNIRQYINIKAGTQMIIPYALFGTDLTRANGKTFKVIFKATNCRDYDGNILHCKVDKYIATANVENEIYLEIPQGTEVEYSDVMNATATDMNLINSETKVFDLTNAESRATFKERYIKFDNKYYQCMIDVVDDTVEESQKQYYAFFYEMFSEKSYDGLLMNAQNATFKSTTQTISTQYCEDRYIEFEIDISKANGDYSYITIWIDGVPAGYTVYGSDSFYDPTKATITIGSDDCDIQLYMLKIYEQSLEDKKHLYNFIADAPTVTEMMERYNRNQVFDSRGIISPDLVAKTNPDCLVHVYTLPTGMTTTKKDKRYGCDYKQYHGSDKVSLSAKNVMIKVQGTSSEKYVVAAANVDADFYNFDDPNYVPTGFIDANDNNKELKEEGWSMDGGTAIGSNFFCTKVNVASCENANNALNQEWYNLFQPYQSLLRCKNNRARDTMQFTNGVIFMEDHNPTYKTSGDYDAKNNNLFGEIAGYISNPYPRFYSIGQMGNSKDNIHIFHDTSNPLECCVEVNDNQEPQQWMISDDYSDNDIDDGKKYFGFRYPDGREEASQTMIDGWRRLVSWMAHSDPSARYAKHTAKTEKEFREFAINKKTGEAIPTFIMREDRTAYDPIDHFDSNYETYYTETEHINGYTNLVLPASVTKRDYGDYTFRGYIADEKIQAKYTPLIKGCKITKYNYQNFINNPNLPQVADENGFIYDCYEYRMAKMIHECEDYLVMDSIIYHYLFIERHCMIDNVAKNTFWSTEDCLHWNLIKDYDNDTADGNDNQGKFTRTYGMEPMDKLNQNVYVFNAHQAVWLNFIAGLTSTCEEMYRKLEERTVMVNGKAANVWDKDTYLDLFEEWQKRIPEACWIEDYYRKYRRPYELYKTTMFNSMMEGGQKTHQRAQFETYQDTYMSSKYFGTTCEESVAIIRGNGANMAKYKLPFTLYSDCYVRSEMGSSESVVRAKRGSVYYLDSAAANINNATIYFYPAKAFSTIGSIDGGRIGGYAPEQIDLSNAVKLREIVVSTLNDGLINTSLEDSFDVKNNNILEKLYVSNLTAYKDKLDLSGCANLREVDARNSTFTEISIANNAPVESLLLGNPTVLILSNLYNLKKFNINNFNRLETLNINNIDESSAIDLNGVSINSQTLVEKSVNVRLTNYKLTNVKWNLSKVGDISNSKIGLLDTLSTKLPLMTDNGLELRKNCLTGSLTISTNAFNGNSQEALKIYENYACGDDPVYPNLKMTFESANTTLYNVNIYDGDDNLVWSRKVIPNTTLNAEFFEDGPNGDFKADEQLIKTATAEFSYNFLKTWNITMGDTVEKNFDSSSFAYANPVYNKPITADIHFRPNFNNQKRSYTVSIILVDPTSTSLSNPELYSKVWEYGTSLPIILADFNKIPSVDNSKLGLLEVYDFKGYSLVKGSSTLIKDGFTVADNTELYTYFKLENNVRKCVHPDWFEIIDEEFVVSQSYTDPDSSIRNVVGLQIGPKYPEMSGKITLPSYLTINGEKKPVVSVKGFGVNTGVSPYTVTHIFMEDGVDNNLYVIDQYAFSRVPTLEYFDFEKCAARFIGLRAFDSCTGLKNTIIGNQIYEVGGYAFNNSMTDTGVITLMLPHTLTKIQSQGFGNLGIAEGSTLQIGSPQALSELNLSSAQQNIFRLNAGHRYTTINFYSKLYPSAETTCQGQLQVKQFFTPALMENGTLYVGTGI